MTLTAEGSPYTGSSVTIESGVTVKAEPGAEVTVGKITVKGTLKAEGSAEEPVLFTSTSKTPNPGDWQNIIFESGSGASVLDHTEVSYAGLVSWSAAIEIKGASPTITHSVIRKAQYIGINVSGGGSPEIAYNEISGNGQTGISYETPESGGAINIHDNVVKSNGGGGITTGASSTTTSTSLGNNTISSNGGQAVSYAGPDIPPDIGTNTLSENGINTVSFAGTFKQSATFTNTGFAYAMNGQVTVASGATWTLKPGILLYGNKTVVKGTLKAEGSAEEPVLFTSTSKTPNPGDWQNIIFESGSGASVLDHTEVSYGGLVSWSAAIEIKGASPTITHSIIRKAQYIGINVSGGGSPEIAHNEISGNGQTGIAYETPESGGTINIHDNVVKSNGGGGITTGASSTTTSTSLGNNTISSNGGQAVSYAGPDIPPDIGTNTLSANTINTVSFAGTFKQSATFTNTGFAYAMNGQVTVASGATWSLKPGILLYGNKTVVKGTLKAEGSAEAPVVFTSSAKTPSPGDWQNIIFESGSGASVLDHTEVSYGGLVTWSAAIEIKGASPTITHSTIRKAQYIGINVSGGGSPEIAYNEISGNGQTGIAYETPESGGTINIHDNVVKSNGGAGITTGASSTTTSTSLGNNTISSNGGQAVSYAGPDIPPDIGTNTLSENGINTVSFAGTFKQSATFTNTGFAYAMNGQVTVAGGATWTLKPGILLYGNKTVVKGTLKAEGSAEKPVLFTSTSKTPSPGDWQNIIFESGSGASVLDHVEVSYAGLGSSVGAIEIKSSSPTITHSALRSNQYYGVRVVSGSPTIEWTSFTGNKSAGLLYEGGGTLSAPHNYWGCASVPNRRDVATRCPEASTGNRRPKRTRPPAIAKARKPNAEKAPIPSVSRPAISATPIAISC